MSTFRPAVVSLALLVSSVAAHAAAPCTLNQTNPSVTVCTPAPNALVQESVRAYYRTWYRDIVTALPEVTDGYIAVPPGPGLGLDLMPDLDKRFTVARRISSAA